MSLTATRLSDLLVEEGFRRDCIFLLDAEYSLPSKQFIEDFGKTFQTFLNNLGMKYKTERFDCDDFAELAKIHAKLCHATYGNAFTGLAFGTVALWTEDGDGHAVNGVVMRENNELVFKLYEPQLCLKEYPKSKVGKLSFCWF